MTAKIEVNNENKYRQELDGIRAFSVLAVIINHFNKDLLPSGYFGVDIFFVISGYVITASLITRNTKNFKEFLLGFYERRIRRLIPALIFFVVTISFLSVFFVPRSHDYFGYAYRSLIGISNISFYRNSLDYFNTEAALNPFAQTWSLGVEEQFYLLFPFLIWFSGYGFGAKYGKKIFLFLLSTLSIASLFSYLYYFPLNQSAAYYLMPNRFWEIASGSILFVILANKNLKIIT